MEFNLLDGFMNVLSPLNLWYAFLGALLGTLVGVLPGLGPSSTLAILLPITMYLPPTGSLIMLAGIYYGAMYGGSTTAVLVNIPGEVSSVPTAIDGYQMTQQGRAGQALAIAAIGSFIAGTFGAVVISLIGPKLAMLALKFGPPEYFGLVFFSLTALISFSGRSLSMGLTAGVLGMLLATVGLDPLTGSMRLNFGSIPMMRGLELIPVLVGLFGISEVLLSAEKGIGKIYEGKLGALLPRGALLLRGVYASVRGTLSGFFLGLLPGMLPALTAYIAYDVEKRVSKHPEEFGKGAIEGVAGPESANNATAMAGFVPLMALGIPTGPSLAVMLAALIMYGLQPGPVLFQQHSLFAWTVIASMYIGNVMLLVLNLPLVGLWARVSLIPYKYLAPVILCVCLVGAYSPRNTMFDVWTAIIFGLVGYFMSKRGWPVAPLILGFILGPMLEQSLRQSITISGGSPLIFFSRPIAAAFIIAALILMFFLNRVKRQSKIIAEIMQEDVPV